MFIYLSDGKLLIQVAASSVTNRWSSLTAYTVYFFTVQDGDYTVYTSPTILQLASANRLPDRKLEAQQWCEQDKRLRRFPLAFVNKPCRILQAGALGW